jgi:hypothetical protein
VSDRRPENGLTIFLAHGRRWRDKLTVTGASEVLTRRSHPTPRVPSTWKQGRNDQTIQGSSELDDGISSIIRRRCELHLVPHGWRPSENRFPTDLSATG